MSLTNYSLPSILPFVRQALRGRGNFAYKDFVTALFTQLETINLPGVERTPQHKMHTLQMFDYQAAPYELKSVTMEAFQYLLRNGYLIPVPPEDTTNLRNVNFVVTERGISWAENIEPIPEDVEGYMKLLQKLVPNLDAVIEQYIIEGLRSFERQTYFAAAVMVGAAAEKSVYLLAESLVGAFKDAAKQSKLRKLIEHRGLRQLFEMTEKTIQDSHTAKLLPYPISDGGATHLMSLIEAIRVQRNDAVHPMNATVSADSVRLSLLAFPHALEKLETLRTWFLANPKTI